MSLSANPPRLSVILVTDRFATIRQVVEAYAAQAARELLEMVIVIPESGMAEGGAPSLDVFGASRVVVLPSILPMAGARAAGVRAATAPVIFIGETHSFPRKGFTEAILAAHEGPWDVVVPGIDNANPDLPGSWGSFLLDYGYWMSGLPAARIGSGPTWNASYKKDLLIGLGPMLDGALSSGDELPMALKARNGQVYFEPAAGVGHVNLESRRWADERFLSGLVVGANRAKRWSLPRRIAYFMGSPLIPLVLIYRNIPSLRQLRREGTLPRGSIAAIVAGAVIRTAGEAKGYLVGFSEEAQARLEEYELNKIQYVNRIV